MGFAPWGAVVRMERGEAMAKKKRKKKGVAALHLPRRKWTRSPAEKAHSSRHGKKGYDRKRERDELAGESEDVGG